MVDGRATWAFDGHDIRCAWDFSHDAWLLSAIDVVAALGVTTNPRRYWSDLKRGGLLGNEVTAAIVSVRLPAHDGHLRETDAIVAVDVPQVVSLIRSPDAIRLARWAASLPDPDDAAPNRNVLVATSAFMPLTDATFAPGNAPATTGTLSGETARAIALAELHYYRGEAEEASALAETSLSSPDLSARLSACWLYGYANLSLNRTNLSITAFSGIRKVLASVSRGTVSPSLQAESTLVARGAATLLHLPAPGGMPELSQVMPALSEGHRLLAAYVMAHRSYLDGNRAESLGIAEGALAFTEATHPIPMIYLHLVCTMDLMASRQPKKAERHFAQAWELARPDGLIEPFAEHHGLLGGMVEKCLKHSHPEEFRRIIDATYRFSYGWRRVHNPTAHDEVADGLSTTQFTVAMLASRGWTNAEIASHLGVSTSTVKAALAISYETLGISRRSELGPFMLG